MNNCYKTLSLDRITLLASEQCYITYYARFLKSITYTPILSIVQVNYFEILL
jgi:hypothetical protein